MCESRSCSFEQVKPSVTEKLLVAVMHMHCTMLERNGVLVHMQTIHFQFSVPAVSQEQYGSDFFTVCVMARPNQAQDFCYMFVD